MIIQELLNKDCIEKMEKFIEKEITFDLIITDPPYGINYKTNHRKNKNHDFCSTIENDEDTEISKKALPLLYKLLKDGGAMYLFTQDSVLAETLNLVEESGFKLKNILVWDKGNWSAGDLKGSYGKKTEFIIYAVKGRHILNPIGDTKRHHNILEFKRVVGKKQVHQNQKPVDLLEFLIKKSSDEGDWVFDPFMGSGSTGIAATNIDRNFYGIELDKKYFDIAKDRIYKGR